MSEYQPEEAEERAIHGLLRELHRGGLGDDEAFVARVMQAIEKPAHTSRRWKSRYGWLLAAAAALVVLCVTWGLIQRPPPRITVATLLTPGEIQREGKSIACPADTPLLDGDGLRTTQLTRIRCTDGSEVKLDNGCALTLQRPVEEERVRLALESGRMFVRAAKAPGRFVVLTDDVRVEVKGTVFGVAQDAQGVQVDVLDGEVTVASAAASLPVKRGQSARATAAIAPSLQDNNPNQALLWARDWTTFRQRPLREVLAWIEANSSFRIHLDPTLSADKVVTLAVAGEPIPDLIGQLAVACGLGCRIEGDEIYLD